MRLDFFSKKDMYVVDASIIIRTFNEEKWLPGALQAINEQNFGSLCVETIVVDSGSTDRTCQVAMDYGCRLIHICKSEFTFGRSLNMGCEAAEGRNLVFISGHCIPDSTDWLQKLISPLDEGLCAYVYGRQVGRRDVSKFSEEMLFGKYFPQSSAIPQEGYFCNNANAAIPKAIWLGNRFDEDVTGLEDMLLAKQLHDQGLKIGYVAEAPVVHLHEESWSKVRSRYEREAIALRTIMPDIHVSFGDFIRYTVAGILFDWSEALGKRLFWRQAGEIALFRIAQYWGTYKGNNDHRKMSRERKERYFYPR